MKPRTDPPAFRPSSHRTGARQWLATVLVLLGLVALQAGCYRTSSVAMFGPGVGASKESRGPVTVDCESHAVADGRGVLFESHVFAKDGFEHRAAFLMLTASEFWYSIEADSEIIQDPEREATRELALGHADFSWGGGVMHSGGVTLTPSATSTGMAVNPANDPNRVSVTVPIDTSELSAPADTPYLAFRGEQVPAPDGSLFLVILTPEGPKRPTRIASELDLSRIPGDPEGFAQRILDEQPLLRELMQEEP